MIRWSTFLWIGAVVLSATVLFQLKYNVQDLESRLARIERDTQKERETIRVLQAEWSYLNKPERLAHLAQTYLSHEAMKPLQISTFATIGPRPEDFGYSLAAAHPQPKSRPDNLLEPLGEDTAIAMAVLDDMQKGQNAHTPLGDKITYVSSSLPLYETRDSPASESMSGVMAASMQVPFESFKDIDLVEVSDSLSASNFPLQIQKPDIWAFAKPLIVSRSIIAKGSGQ